MSKSIYLLLFGSPFGDHVGLAIDIIPKREVNAFFVANSLKYKGLELKTGSEFDTTTIMMKADVLKTLQGYRVSNATARAEDADLWFRFFQHGYSGYNLEEPLYRYRETLNDYKKRTVKAAAGTVRVMLDGYKRLGFPWYVYPLAFKPLLAALVPDRIMKKYHQK